MRNWWSLGVMCNLLHVSICFFFHFTFAFSKSKRLKLRERKVSGLFCVKRSLMIASESCSLINWFRVFKDNLLTPSTHVCRYNLLDLVDHFHNRGLDRSIFLRCVLNNRVLLQLWAIFSPPYNWLSLQHNGRWKFFEGIFSWNQNSRSMPQIFHSSLPPCISGPWNCRLFHTISCQVSV